MSYFSHAFQMMMVGNGTIRLTGGTELLTAGEMGVYNYNTFKALPAVGASTNPLQMFIIAQGSYHTTDSLSPFLGGLKESVKSRGINPKFIEKFYKVLPSDPVADVWAVGYNGVTDCECITGECDKTYSLRIDVKGDVVSRTYNRNLYRTISVTTPCCGDDCASCIEDTVDPKWIAEQFVEKINNDPELKHFVLAELMFEVLPTYTVNDSLTYTVLVTDAGDATALAAMNTFYGAGSTVRASYTGGVSTYTVTLSGTATAPATTDDIDPGAGTVNPNEVTGPNTVLFARELCITIPGLDDVTADIDTFYTDRTDVAASTIKETGTSAITYSIFQTAEAAVEIGEDTVGTPTYADLPSYEGYVWEECPCLEEEAAYTDCMGIKLTAAYEDTVFGDCSFHPTDYYNVQPLKIYVSKVDDAELCDHMEWGITHLVESKQGSGFGETYLREYLTFMNYKQEYWEHDTRFREVMNQNHLTAIDRTAKYKALHLIHSIPNYVKGMNVKSYDEKYHITMIFEESVNTAAFETFLSGYTELNGVFLETY